ncbi:MAG: nucleoside triphosphate pyrophosphohydrolase [Ignavibacteriales bacterium]|nr:nucleoside triphosphate pyrophosphohydrolase [Ignavibacteriales bacterium]
MKSAKFENLFSIVQKLRKECPWDRAQTMESLKPQTIEEAYEVIEAIEDKNYEELKKELGDLLLHVLFYSSIADEINAFNIEDVIDSITEKLIRRHPHVFGHTIAEDKETVKTNWEQIKLNEGRKSILEGVPRSLPNLQRAVRLQEKASKVGFDWEKKEDVWNKVIEEIVEMKEAEKENDTKAFEQEMGDVFFALTNFARYLNINPEEALRKTNEKFIKRFQFIEEQINKQGKKIYEVSLKEMDKYWEESKSLF